MQAAPSVAGAGQAGSAETCQGAQWSLWAGVGPSAGLYPFDAYRWLLDGVPIAGQSGQSYTPTGADVGHQLACQIAVTYPLPLLVTPASATSAAITVQSSPSPLPSPPPPAPPSPPSVPALAGLRVSPHTFTLTGRLVNGRCGALTRADRSGRRCTRRVALNVSYTLSAAATVTFTIEATTPGGLVHGRCLAPARAERPCTRVLERATLERAGGAAANRLLLPARIGRLRLTPGSYLLLATPAADGRTGKQRRATFRIAALIHTAERLATARACRSREHQAARGSAATTSHQQQPKLQ